MAAPADAPTRVSLRWLRLGWRATEQRRWAQDMDEQLKQIQMPLAVCSGIAFLTLLLWFLRKHRNCLTASFVLRHSAFLLSVYLGVLWFLYEERITTLVFGHVVYKHSPQEIPAVLVILGGVIFWFAVGVFLLGRNRRAEFQRYVEAFPFLRRFLR